MRLGVHLRSYLLAPTWDDPPYYSLLIEESDLAAPGSPSGWPVPSSDELRQQNVEYVSKRDTLRLGPVRIVRIADGFVGVNFRNADWSGAAGLSNSINSHTWFPTSN